MTESYDVKKDKAQLYAPKQRFEIVEVPTMRFLMADGRGDPNRAPEYADVVTALYTFSYAVRAVAKAELGRVHTVGPLEGLWSAPDLAAFRTRAKDEWEWTLMIVQPEWVTGDVFSAAAERIRRSKKEIRAGARVRLEDFDEGLCVQILHVGPYDEEGPVIARMHDEFIPDEGLQLRGRHHEIYLSDVRRTPPAKLRTVLRQPVSRRH